MKKDECNCCVGTQSTSWESWEVEIIEEEKKIPEKLEGIDSLFKIEQDLDLKGFLAWQKANNKIIENKINEIIDYLKNKGE